MDANTVDRGDAILPFARPDLNVGNPTEVSLSEIEMSEKRRTNRIKVAMLITTSAEWLASRSENLSEGMAIPEDINADDWKLTKAYLRELRRHDFSFEIPNRTKIILTPDEERLCAMSGANAPSEDQGYSNPSSDAIRALHPPRVKVIEVKSMETRFAQSVREEGYDGADHRHLTDLQKSPFSKQKSNLERTTASDTGAFRNGAKLSVAKPQQAENFSDSRIYKDHISESKSGNGALAVKNYRQPDQRESEKTSSETEDEFTREADKLFPDGKFRIGGERTASDDESEWDSIIIPPTGNSEDDHGATPFASTSNTRVNVLTVAYPTVSASSAPKKATWRWKNNVSPSSFCGSPPSHPAAGMAKTVYNAPDYSIFLASSHTRELPKREIPKSTIPVKPERSGNMAPDHPPKEMKISNDENLAQFDSLHSVDEKESPQGEIAVHGKRKGLLSNIRRRISGFCRTLRLLSGRN